MGELLVLDWLAPGDNLLTRDSVTEREWLDLTETVLPEVDGNDPAARLAAFQSRLMEGGDLSGFRIATTDDVFQLAVSAGIDPDTSDITVNRVPAATLVTFTTSDGIVVELGENAIANGLTVSSDLQSVRIGYVPSGRDLPTAFVIAGPLVSSTESVWIYRESVPEPAALSLLTILSLASTLMVRGARRTYPPGGRDAPSNPRKQIWTSSRASG